MDVRRVAAEAYYPPAQDSYSSEDDYSGIDWNEVFLFSDEDEEL